MTREIEIARQREMIEMAREMRLFSLLGGDAESATLWTRQIVRSILRIRAIR